MMLRGGSLTNAAGIGFSLSLIMQWFWLWIETIDDNWLEQNLFQKSADSFEPNQVRYVPFS